MFDEILEKECQCDRNMCDNEDGKSCTDNNDCNEEKCDSCTITCTDIYSFAVKNNI